jgi:hypothetical protein
VTVHKQNSDEEAIERDKKEEREGKCKAGSGYKQPGLITSGDGNN